MIRRLVAAALAAAYVAHVRHLTERAMPPAPRFEPFEATDLGPHITAMQEAVAAFGDAVTAADFDWPADYMDEPTPEFAAVEALFARIDAEVAAALPELRAVETVEDFLYAAGGEA